MDEVIGARFRASIVHQGFNLLWRLACKVETVGDVLSNRTGEKDGFLLDNSDLVMVPLRVELLDIDTVEEDLALIRVIEALKQLDNGRFAAATGSTERNDAVLLVIDVEGDTLKHLVSLLTLAWVGELDVVDLEASTNLSGDGPVAGVFGLDLRLGLHELDHFLRGATDRSQVAEDESHDHEVEANHEHVEHEGGKFADRDVSILEEDLTDVDDRDHGTIHHDHVYEGEESLVGCLLLAGVVGDDIGDTVLFDLAIFTAEGFHGADVRKGLLGHRVHLRLLRLDHHLKLAHPLHVEVREDDSGEDATEHDSGEGG